MAHQIETLADGSALFATAQVPAWHRLGVVFPGRMTAEEVLSAAQLGGWDVRKEPVAAMVLTGACPECQAAIGDRHPAGCLTGDDSESQDNPDRIVQPADTTELLDVPGAYASIRNHPLTGRPDPLGPVGPDWTPVQNEVMAAVMEAITDETGAIFETGGSLREGTEVFLTAKLPEGMLIGGVDLVDTYLAANNFHAGGSLRLDTTPVRQVCANTQRMVFANHHSTYTFRHTPGITSRIQEAREALKMSWAYTEVFAAEAEKLLAVPMETMNFEKLVFELWPQKFATETGKWTDADDQMFGDLTDLWSVADTQENIRGTRWAAYQAVTEYVDHKIPTGKDHTAEDSTRVRAERTMAGTYSPIKHRAWSLLSA